MEMLRAWVGCLACYNDGRLIGHWYDADECGDLTVEKVHKDGGATHLTGLGTPDAYRWSPDGEEPAEEVEGHEEIWCLDLESYGLIKGECSPMEVARVWEVVKDLGDDVGAAYVAFIDCYSYTVTEESVTKFEDAFQGVWDSERSYAEDYYEEAATELEKSSNPLADHIDWEGVTRELFMGDLSTEAAPGGRIYVFDGSCS